MVIKVKEQNNIKLDLSKIPVNRILLLVISDLLAVLLASVMGLYVRFDFSFTLIPRQFWDIVLGVYGYNVLVTLIVFYIFRLYKSVWRYASDTELINIAIAVLICSIMQPVMFWVLEYRVPRSYPFFYGFFLMLFVCGVRFSYRIVRMFQKRRKNQYSSPYRLNCMIVGAGAAGNAILKEIESSKYLNLHVSCVIDDGKGCHGKFLRGIPIVGGRENISESVEKYNIDEIIIAIPSASPLALKPILEICKETGCHLRTLPGMYQILNGEVNVSKLREVQIEDLLGRDPITVNTNEILDYVKDRKILVTGAGGSIGSELCRQIAEHHPQELIMVDIYENNLYDIQLELKHSHPELNLTALIASVRNELRMDEIFKTHRPEIVYHAAAHKHVPLMEDSPNEAIKNNVFGTYKTAKAANKYEVKRFVLISTDKAVNPTNIMGASKRICEMIVQNMNRKSNTEYVAVRFGNVLGSNGSVVPLFKKQIEHGGPVTVTHPDIIRYFMTISEAVSLVLQAGVYAKGGEIFVLDMGEPMKIVDLAENMIKLSGYRVNEDIRIEFTGLRPGEKMYEEVLMSEEGLGKTANKMIFVGQPLIFDDGEFEKQLEELQVLAVGESDGTKELVKKLVPTYQLQK